MTEALAQRLRELRDLSEKDAIYQVDLTAVLFDNLDTIIAALTHEGMGWRPIETAPKDGTLVDLWVLHSSFGFVSGTIHRNCKWCDAEGEAAATWVANYGYGVALEWQHTEEEDGSLTTSLPTHWLPVVTNGPNGERHGTYIKRPASPLSTQGKEKANG